MPFIATSFIFDGTPSEQYGLMIYDLDNHKQDDVSLGSKAEIHENRASRNHFGYHYGVTYNAPLTFTMVFGIDDDRERLDKFDLGAVAMWLTGHQQYKWLQICQEDMETFRYKCLITELTPISIRGLPVAFEATVQCDGPYAYHVPYVDTIACFPSIVTVKDLLSVAWKAYGAKVPDLISLDALLKNSGTLKKINGVTGEPNPNDWFFRNGRRGENFGSIAEFNTALKNAIVKVKGMGQAFAEGLTWIELQHLLLGNNYQSESSLRNNVGIKYWWEAGAKEPICIHADAEIEYVSKVTLEVYYQYGTYTEDDMNHAWLEIIDKLHLRNSADPISYREYGATDIPIIIDILQAAMERLYTDLYNTDIYWNISDNDENWLQFTWNELQYLLINAPDVSSDEHGIPQYFWKPGALGTISDLLQVAYAVYRNDEDAQLLVNANTTKLKELFLMSNVDGEPFTSSSSIQTALEAAVKALTTVPAPYDGTTVDTATWKEIQYAMIHGAYAADADITEDYWWKDGGAPTITTEGDIFKYAYKVYEAGGDAKLLDNVTLDKLDEFYLRSADSGAKFNNRSLFLSALQGAVHALVNDGGLDGTTIAAADWKEYQYALINGAYKSLTDIEADRTIDYWWQNGNTKTISTLEDLLQAAYFVYGDGSDPTALDSITDDTVAAFGQGPFWLRSEAENGTPFTTAAEFKATLQHVIAQTKPLGFNSANMNTLTWLQVQYMLLDDDRDGNRNSYKGNTALEGMSSINYWWLGGGEKPSGENPDAVVGNVLILASQLNENFAELTDPTILTDYISQYIDGLGFRNASGSSYTAAALQAAIESMVAASYNDGLEDYWDPETAYVAMTWHEVQYYLIEGSFAKEGTFPGYAWKPALVPSTNPAIVAEILSLMEEAAWATGDEPIADPVPEAPTDPKSEAPVLPEGPAVPEEPETPKIPEVPEAPVTPAEPVIPEEPEETPSTGEAGPPPSSSEGEANGDEGDEETDGGTAEIVVSSMNESPLTPLLEAMESYLSTGGDQTAINAAVTYTKMNSTYTLRRLATGGTYSNKHNTTARNAIVTITTEAGASPYYINGKLKLDWYQIQYAIINPGSVVSPATAKAASTGWSIAPAWADDTVLFDMTTTNYTYYCESNVQNWYYPKISIICPSSYDLDRIIIENKQDPQRPFKVSGLSQYVGKPILINGTRGVVSCDGTVITNQTNMQFPRVVPGRNDLTIIGIGTVTIYSEPPVNVGA